MKKENIEKGAKFLLAAGLVLAGIGHLTFLRKEFQAQVPNWVPLTKDDTVLLSGLVEIAMGTALLLAPKKYEKPVGLIAAGLFIAVFPGNIAQYQNKISAFGLNTDSRRFARLLFQPVLVFWALKSSGNLNRRIVK
ncbi:hypothetical protein EZJ43_14680 [Pedobacter changchengzhani]|uniref:DoxX family membrane protein n=1 Tax=Pedobacter changchengzhani TaxID=2529274 RepID=A0A4R5MIH2_9SPHI|nr:hypothetical protein [Pedobacter changchengzhani]TDG35146.1 hypothetical protein EZJ43_14680 [Pedobacter changchengzhani]